MSASGQYQTANSSANYIYISSDYGNSWTQDTSVGSTKSWNRVAISASGQYQVATATSSNIYVSSNYGATWTSTASSLNWLYVAISGSGQYITAVYGSAGYIYTCYNTINAQGVINVGSYTTASGVTGIAGSIYYDTTTTTLKYSNGSTWNTIGA
ncbi:MAG: hypothetical protein EBS90_13540, partial [Betaproteobacteria bacterium]|nr:hypothetical protein [Betaproteobacteria bacterium]